MSQTASQITSLTIVYSIVYWGTDQGKHQSSTSLAFVWGIHRGLVNSPHKWPAMRKMFPFDDVIMHALDTYFARTVADHRPYMGLLWLNKVPKSLYLQLKFEYKEVKCTDMFLMKITAWMMSWWCHQMVTFPSYWPLVRGIHRSPVNSSHKGQWRGALMFLWPAPEKWLSKQSRGWWFKTSSCP